MLPTFVIIGAAKAGTTALYWYLREHPAVFMSPVKETNYFAYGLDGQGRLLYGDPEANKFPIRTPAEYEELFDEAGNAAAVGEASPIYLECPQAAARIHGAIPSARIIGTLRHPVDRAYSDYLMHLRRRGRRFDAGTGLSSRADWAQPGSHWMQIGRYHGQLARYFELFPREQIHVFLFDDLMKSPAAVMQDVYRFVGVNPAFVPDFETPHAIGGMPANRLLEGFLTSHVIRTAVKPWVPRAAAHWVRRLRGRNMRKAPPLPPELKKELTRPFHDDIRRTSELIGRNLDHWL